MKNKTFYLIIGVIIFISLIFGITYAIFAWASDPSGGFINATSECLVVNYTKGEDVLNGVLVISGDYSNGANATVKAKISDDCPTMNGVATLYIDVKDATSDYLIDNDLLRYQVLEDGKVVDGASGILTDKGRNVVYSGAELNHTDKSFTVYVWVDKEGVNNDNLATVYNSIYSIGINMSVEGR